MAGMTGFLRKLAEETNVPRALGWGGWFRYRSQRRWLDRAPRLTLASLTSKHARWPVQCRAQTSDAHSFHQIFIQREYSCLDDLDQNGKGLIIDCGANVGYSAAYFLTRFPNRQLVAVEPDAESFAVLQRNLEPYGPRAQAIQAAVWSHPASLTARAEWNEHGKEWGRAVRECEPGEPAAFSAVSVGSIFKESGFDRISILKMDIEGAEAVVFAGDYDEWLSKVDVLVIELHFDSPFGATHEVFDRAIKGQAFETSHFGELTICRRVSTAKTPRRGEF
jgi:FkbM family methyltransferase